MLILHTFFLLFAILFALYSSVESEYLSPDSLKIYHDITAGRGLYPDSKEITNMNETNFKKLVFNNTKKNAWLIEFYNSWCGHCHRFATTWKQLGLDIYGWRDIISIGAVDCSSRFNTPLCRDYEVMYYPMLKYFPPSPENNFLGAPVRTFFGQPILNKVLKLVRNEVDKGAIDEPALLPFTGGSIQSVWDGVPSEVQFVVLLLQTNETYFGEILTLDTLKIKEIKTLTSLSTNKELVDKINPPYYPSIYIVDRNNQLHQVIMDKFIDRKGMYNAVRSYLLDKGLEIPELKLEVVPKQANIDVTQIMALMELEEQIKKKLNLNAMNDMVFQVDLENALLYSLTVEIPAHKNITGQALIALKRFVHVLVKDFPFNSKGKSYLKYIFSEIESNSEMTGSRFGQIEMKANNLYTPYLSPNSSWLGCRGSEPRYRGYPCGLWMMFHTLTVQAFQASAADPKLVLRAMVGYVKYFFGCTDCSNHFLEMARTFEGNVTTNRDSVLWLWKAHNSVNKRLKSDQTEDPKHPKVIFPPKTLCSSCYHPDESWDEEGVLFFLRSMYTNISYFLVEEESSSTTAQSVMPQVMRHENVVEDAGYNYSQAESKQLNFNFNVFDVSICVVLYVISMVIILVICLKFLYKRTSRKKLYIYDIFQKV